MLFPIKKEFKQTFFHYSLWEDWKNGMYETSRNNDSLITKSLFILSDEELCFVSMKKVIDCWPISTMQNLTNLSINRCAWLGWSSCSLAHNSTQIQTILAWNFLKEKHQVVANFTAMRIIHLFESRFMDGFYEN